MQITSNLLCLSLYSLICVGINATLWGVANKYRLTERYQLHRKLYMPAEICSLCVSFWGCLFYTAPLAFASGNKTLLFAAFIVAGISAKIK